MTMWLPNLEGRRGPVYRAIADAIDEDVQAGTLKAGAKLPPRRDLADHPGVTVTTITRASTEAARRGLTSGQVGRGTVTWRHPERRREFRPDREPPARRLPAGGTSRRVDRHLASGLARGHRAR